MRIEVLSTLLLLAVGAGCPSNVNHPDDEDDAASPQVADTPTTTPTDPPPTPATTPGPYAQVVGRLLCYDGTPVVPGTVSAYDIKPIECTYNGCSGTDALLLTQVQVDPDGSFVLEVSDELESIWLLGEPEDSLFCGNGYNFLEREVTDFEIEYTLIIFPFFI